MTKKVTPLPTVDPHIGELESRISLLESNLARAVADYQNLEKRFARDSAGIVKFANASILEKLLETRDHLGAAATHLQDSSLNMILSSLDKILTDEGVTAIDTSGEFDPATMQCQEIVPGPANKVISVTRLGYRLHDRLLRAARVTVGSGVKESKSN